MLSAVKLIRAGLRGFGNRNEDDEMPITITAHEFKTATRSRYYARPFNLKEIDRMLETYHARHLAASPKRLHRFILHLSWEIEFFVEGKERITENGVTRYNHYRDRTGIIARLEDQVLAELDRLRHVIGTRDQQHRQIAQAGAAFVGAMRERQQAAAAERQRFEELANFGPPAVAAGQPPAMPPADDTYSRVDDSDGVETQLQGLPPTNRVRAIGVNAAAVMARACGAGQVTMQAMQTAVDAGVRAAGVVAPHLMFSHLALGMQHLGLNVSHVPAPTLHHLQTVLMRATPQSPVMVVVGGNGVENRAIVVKGHAYGGVRNQQMYFTCSDGQHGTARCMLHTDGTFSVATGRGGEVEYEQLLPFVGYIKMQL